MKRVLVLGNGFDLDLGFDTTYKTFAESFFAKNVFHEKSKLFDFLYDQYTHIPDKSWFNFEEEIKKYALSVKSISLDDNTSDKKCFDFLRYSLMGTIDIMAWTTPLEETSDYVLNHPGDVSNPKQLGVNSFSIAAKLLNTIAMRPSYFDHIISFNYTPLGELIKKEMFKIDSSNEASLDKKYRTVEERISYLHVASCGSNQHDYRAVLGINDQAITLESLKYLKKSSQIEPEFRAEQIQRIFNADEIVIFGLSLGECDEDYFKPLFLDLFSDSPSKDRLITVITCNNKMGILDSIKRMAGNQNITPHHNSRNIRFIDTAIEESHVNYTSLINEMIFMSK